MSGSPPRPRHDQRTCPGCGTGDLEDGFIEDSGEGGKGCVRRIAGPLELGRLGGAKRSGKVRRRVDALRCRVCALRCRVCGLLSLDA